MFVAKTVLRNIKWQLEKQVDTKAFHCSDWVAFHAFLQSYCWIIWSPPQKHLSSRSFVPDKSFQVRVVIAYQLSSDIWMKWNERRKLLWFVCQINTDSDINGFLNSSESCTRKCLVIEWKISLLLQGRAHRRRICFCLDKKLSVDRICEAGRYWSRSWNYAQWYSMTGNTGYLGHKAKTNRCLSYVSDWLIRNKWLFVQQQRTCV